MSLEREFLIRMSLVSSFAMLSMSRVTVSTHASKPYHRSSKLRRACHTSSQQHHCTWVVVADACIMNKSADVCFVNEQDGWTDKKQMHGSRLLTTCFFGLPIPSHAMAAAWAGESPSASWTVTPNLQTAPERGALFSLWQGCNKSCLPPIIFCSTV